MIDVKIDFEWQDRASCRGADVDVFFPLPGRRLDRMALRVCAACPVQAECLEMALELNAQGVWGGTSELDRRRIRAARRRAAA